MFKLTYEVWFGNLDDALAARAKFDQTPVGRITSNATIEPIDVDATAAP